MALLNESSDKLMRILNNHLKNGCIIASFQREIDNTLAKKKERLALLKDFVSENGYGYIIIDGRYVYQEDNDELKIKKGDVSDELSVLIPMRYTKKLAKVHTNGNTEPSQKEFDDFAKSLCVTGEQECVLVCYDDLYWWEDKTGKIVAELGFPTIADAASAFYSRIRKGAKRKEKNTSSKYGFTLKIDKTFEEISELCSLNILGNANYAMVAECKSIGDIRTSHLLKLDTYGSMLDYDFLNEVFDEDSKIRKEVLHYL